MTSELAATAQVPSGTSAFRPFVKGEPAARSAFFSAKGAKDTPKPPPYFTLLQRMTVCLHEMQFWYTEKMGKKTAPLSHRRFQVYQYVGSGTTGVAFAAHDTRTGRDVVIKYSIALPTINPHAARMAARAYSKNNLTLKKVDLPNVGLAKRFSPRKVEDLQSTSSPYEKNVYAIALQPFFKNRAYCKSVSNEFSILQDLQTVDGVVRCLGYFEPRPYQFAVVEEFLPSPLLSCMPKIDVSFQWKLEVLRSFVRQMALFLAGMKKKGIAHGDLKPEHVSFDPVKELIFKVCDFGSAKKIDSNFSRPMYHTTRWYRAPEVMLDIDDWGCEIDMWSAGCILFETVTGDVLFPSHGDDDQQALTDHLNLVIQMRGSFPRSMFTKGRAIDNLLGLQGRAYRFKSATSAQAKTVLRYREARWKHPLAKDPLKARLYLGLKGFYPDRAVADFADLVSKMVQYPSKRLTPAGMLEHPFLSSL